MNLCESTVWIIQLLKDRGPLHGIVSAGANLSKVGSLDSRGSKLLPWLAVPNAHVQEPPLSVLLFAVRLFCDCWSWEKLQYLKGRDPQLDRACCGASVECHQEDTKWQLSRKSPICLFVCLFLGLNFWSPRFQPNSCSPKELRLEGGGV